MEVVVKESIAWWRKKQIGRWLEIDSFTPWAPFILYVWSCHAMDHRLQHPSLSLLYTIPLPTASDSLFIQIKNTNCRWKYANQPWKLERNAHGRPILGIISKIHTTHIHLTKPRDERDWTLKKKKKSTNFTKISVTTLLVMA